jgi:hypothetical protein
MLHRLRIVPADVLGPTRRGLLHYWRNHQMRRQREMTMVRGFRLVCRYRFVPPYTGRRKPCSSFESVAIV